MTEEDTFTRTLQFLRLVSEGFLDACSTPLGLGPIGDVTNSPTRRNELIAGPAC